MVLKIPDSGLVLDASVRSMASLPQQAFAVTLSDSVIEHMIECVQDGQDIQLSLGSNPVSFYFALCLLFGLPTIVPANLRSRSGLEPLLEPSYSLLFWGTTIRSRSFRIGSLCHYGKLGHGRSSWPLVSTSSLLLTANQLPPSLSTTLVYSVSFLVTERRHRSNQAPPIVVYLRRRRTQDRRLPRDIRLRYFLFQSSEPSET